ncbi:MAG: hypothetical protein J7K21_03055 [Desulfurococcales archaeon]|nr:hypothetical protein [Desulfurococcales archaeon]
MDLNTIFYLLIPSSLIFLPIIALFRGKTSNYIVHGVSITVSIIIIILSLYVLASGSTLDFTYKICLDYSYPILSFKVIHFRLDSLSAFFTLVLGIVSLASSIYGIGYIGRFYGREHIGWYGVNYLLFIISMYGVLTTYNLFIFIIFWELMTLSSQFLVSYEKNKKQALWAGYKYFCVSKLGAEMIIIAGLVLMIIYSGYNVDYEVVASRFRELFLRTPVIANAVLMLLFMGLGIKAALVPFHNWLPDAHPEAPSNVSALLSGVMIKMPIYMMYRLFYQFSQPTIYWGVIISSFGVVTLFTGTLYALVQIDSKRLLAYHSIGQIGYVVLGLGASGTLYAMGNYPLAFIALLGSMYHLINHALFKSLLFLTAGSVVYRTGLRDLNKLSGLAKYMPLTALTALIASLSIAGIPPFNGFVSKWIIYISTFCAGGYLAFYGLFALFISSVTAASFVKYFTTIFTRSPFEPGSYKKLEEVPFPMSLAQVMLAALCILFGIVVVIPLKLITSAISLLGLNIIQYQYISFGIGFIEVNNIGVNSPLFIGFILAIILPILYILIARPRYTSYGIWSCGTLVKEGLLHYPGRSYFRGFKEVFSEAYTVGKAVHEVLGVTSINYSLKFFKKLQRIIEDPVAMIVLTLVVVLLIIWAVGW